MASASDEAILAAAREQGRAVVTLDADFHAVLALGGAAGPSVIRIRMEGLRAEPLADLVRTVVAQCGEDLAAGAVVSVTEGQIRVRRLPVGGRRRRSRRKSRP